jgi:ribose 5-phosphate isomerase B
MIFIGADHAGYQTKEHIKKFLDKNKIRYKDFGSSSPKKPDDYPDYAKKVAKSVAKDKNSKGILICGTGTGMVMAANKIKGARAALVYDNYTAVKSREDNDANIIALRGRGFSREKAKILVKIWLKTKFSNKPRHKRRIQKINRMR